MSSTTEQIYSFFTAAASKEFNPPVPLDRIACCHVGTVLYIDSSFSFSYQRKEAQSN